MILSNERINKAYHRGEFELKVKRGTSLRDAAAMSIMRWFLYDKAKLEFINVHKTHGYITKFTRIKNKIQKSHSADAFCIANNVKAERLESYIKIRMFPRHNRALHVCNPQRNGIRRSTIASHWIGKSRLQRFDSVIYNGIKCFIYGSSNGRPILRDIDGIPITSSQYVSAKKVVFLKRNKSFILQELNN